MPKNYIWYWGCENPNPQNFILVDILVDNFNQKEYRKFHKYLKKNIKYLSSEIVNLRNFFEQINKIIGKKISKEAKIKKIMNLRDRNKKKFITKEVAKIIVDSFEYPYANNGNDNSKDIDKEQKGGSKNQEFGLIEKQLNDNYHSLNSFIDGVYNTELSGGAATPVSILEDQYLRFRELNKKNASPELENKIKNTVGLNQLVSVFHKFAKHEYSIPINLNDILLIGFSLLPHIGWIFDIFMIFRALIEKRYIYAILMTINCYQYLFNKLISFGLLGINFGPIIKLFYLAPYANKDFNLQNIKLKLDSFLATMNININRELMVT